MLIRDFVVVKRLLQNSTPGISMPGEARAGFSEVESMPRTHITWRERWNGFWEKQQQTQFEAIGLFLGTSLGIFLTLPDYAMLLGLLFSLLGMTAVNLWSGHFFSRRPIAAFFVGLSLMMLMLTTKHHPEIAPSTANDVILGVFILAYCLVMFANRGKQITRNVQQGLENLAWGIACCFGQLAFFWCFRAVLPPYLLGLVLFYCLVNLHAGTARAGGWEPRWPYVLDIRHTVYE